MSETPVRSTLAPPRPLGPPPLPEQWLSLSEAAAYLGVIPGMLRKAVKRKRLGPVTNLAGHVAMVQWKSVIQYQETMGQVRSEAQLQRRERERVEQKYRDALATLNTTLATPHALEWLRRPRAGARFPLNLERAQSNVAVLTATLEIALERARLLERGELASEDEE